DDSHAPADVAAVEEHVARGVVEPGLQDGVAGVPGLAAAALRAHVVVALACVHGGTATGSVVAQVEDEGRVLHDTACRRDREDVALGVGADRSCVGRGARDLLGGTTHSQLVVGVHAPGDRAAATGPVQAANGARAVSPEGHGLAHLDGR